VVFLFFYRAASFKAAQERKNKNALLDGLQKEEKVHKQILDSLKKERQGLFENIKALNTKYQKDKNKLKINEEEMFKEIISLEEQLNSYIALKQNKEEEIKELKSKIQNFERRKSSKNLRNEFDFTSKRFGVLYKHIQMNRKAISGLLNMNEDQQIKAEECILKLDTNPNQVTIKRKVFSGKKHKTACLEVLFAYNGRLYFKQDENNKIEVLVIGTKNTQVKDMEFLHNI
jgi:chromosome segregation ATPase